LYLSVLAHHKVRSIFIAFYNALAYRSKKTDDSRRRPQKKTEALC